MTSLVKQHLIKNTPTHPRDVRLDLSESKLIANRINYYSLSDELKPKKNRWWKNTILICCCISVGSATLAILAMLRLIG